MSASAAADRIFLFVPPEEAAQVRSLGARWDAATKRWYVASDQSVDKFSPWLASSEDDEEKFTISSDRAFVAETTVPCQTCGAAIEVICIHCESGTVMGDPLPHFTVSDICDMDESLALQLGPWPNFRKADEQSDDHPCIANHCPHCGARQDDMLLHSEPDHPFFDIPHAGGAIELTPLTGAIRLTGDEHFSLD